MNSTGMLKRPVTADDLLGRHEGSEPSVEELLEGAADDKETKFAKLWEALQKQKQQPPTDVSEEGR